MRSSHAPISTYNGALKDVPAPQFGAIAIRPSFDCANRGGGHIGTLVINQVVQAGAKMNPARQAAIKARIQVKVPTMTVNRVCGTRAQATATAAKEVMYGFVQGPVAGGMENMDQSLSLMTGGR